MQSFLFGFISLGWSDGKHQKESGGVVLRSMPFMVGTELCAWEDTFVDIANCSD